MTEEQKARRRKRANEIRILASPQRMTRQDFEARYRSTYVITGSREEIENTFQEMHCDECMGKTDWGNLEGYVLHVTIEDDPLRNFWKLATLRCYNCGFEEIIPLDTPAFTPSDFNSLGAVGLPTAPGQIVRYDSSALAAPLNGEPWRHEYERQRQVYAAKQQAAMQLGQVQQRSIYPAVKQMEEAMARGMQQMQQMTGLIEPPPEPRRDLGRWTEDLKKYFKSK